MIKENLYAVGKIRTFTGKYIDPLNPDTDLIDIIDIAHSLSMQVRFGGHLPVPFTVAQHSIEVSYRVPNMFRLTALLHDASEAYLLDIPSPVKKHITGYKEYEDNLSRMIAEKFETWVTSDTVKEADEAQLQDEWSTYMLQNGKNGYVMSHQEAERTFLRLFNEYSK